MKLYRTEAGPVMEDEGRLLLIERDWDALFNADDLAAELRAAARGAPALERLEGLRAPIGAQEIWAAGVTYWRSRTARMDESKDAGGGSFYDRVYEAERPELFFKAAGWRARTSGQPVRVRRDSRWNVPEPELVLCANRRGEIVGCTVGNDMSSRDIEGENPLYLPQAKIYDGACAIGPALLVGPDPLPAETVVSLEIRRAGTIAFQGETALARMRRSPRELVDWLFRETSFPAGAYLFTGTGIVPSDDFSLRPGDEVRIEIAGVGLLVNPVE